MGPIAHGEPSASQAAELRSCYLSSLDLLLEHRLRSAVRGGEAGGGGAGGGLAGGGAKSDAVPSPFSLPLIPRRSPAYPLECSVSGVYKRKGADGRCAGRDARRGREWAGQGGAARGGARDSLGPTVPSSGYPNEAAAEVVLTALREWLEQHKDKVRPGSSRREGTEVGGGAHVTSPTRHRQGVCRVPARGPGLALALCVLFYSGRFPPLRPGHRALRERDSGAHTTPRAPSVARALNPG